MKKILFLFLSTVFLFAFNWHGKVKWQNNYNTAKKLATKEHKLIYVDISLSYCPPCQYIASYIYKNNKISDYMNKHFIPMIYLADKDKIPHQIQTYFKHITPAIIFIKPNGKLFTYFVGARKPSLFLNILKEIEYKYKNPSKKFKLNFKSPKFVSP